MFKPGEHLKINHPCFSSGKKGDILEVLAVDGDGDAEVININNDSLNTFVIQKEDLYKRNVEFVKGDEKMVKNGNIFKHGQLWIVKDYVFSFASDLKERTVLEIVDVFPNKAEVAKAEDPKGYQYTIHEGDAWDGSVVRMDIKPGTKMKLKQGRNAWVFPKNGHFLVVMRYNGEYHSFDYTKFGELKRYWDWDNNKRDQFSLDFNTVEGSQIGNDERYVQATNTEIRYNRGTGQFEEVTTTMMDDNNVQCKRREKKHDE